ncbi:MAG: ArsR family transcriptional regulator [Streptosporangiales bacterium]|nr:ArsR family transcriptional regulator [Streptosporangiales bacterium]MBO0889422.1 ArsR family transcriptional regulator [Acidothermales bacterium]
MASARPATPAFVHVAAHPVRWRLLTELAASDHRVRELVELVGQPQNLVSYHLRLLRGAGLVSSRRSSFDARDSYYHLDLDRCATALTGTGAALHPALRVDPPAPPTRAALRRRPCRVLFACTGNSSRSPMAEALLRHRTRGTVRVTSAGSIPKDRLHPDAVRVLRDDHGIDVRGRRPRRLDSVATHRFDYVVTLCDKVREVCPEFPDHPRLLHWSIPDPAADAAGYAAFRRAAADIDTRIGHLLHLIGHTDDMEVHRDRAR